MKTSQIGGPGRRGGTSAILILACCLNPGFSAAVSASPLAQASDKTTAASAKKQAASNFEHFRKESDAWKLLNDSRVKSRIKRVMGNDIEEFWNCTQTTNGLALDGNDLFTTGGVMGLSGDRCSFFNFNVDNGKVCLGYLIDNTLHVYGAAGKKDLPRAVAHYLESLDSAVKVRFERANWTPVAIVKTRSEKKSLNLKIVTGSYVRDPSRFSSGDLQVQALPDGKIKFAISVSNGGHTGEAAGTVPLIGDRAIYKASEVVAGSDGQLELKFRGKDVVISGPDQPFCGAGVTISGVYVKTDDHVPKFTAQ